MCCAIKRSATKIKNSGSINLYNDVWRLIYYIAITNKTAEIVFNNRRNLAYLTNRYMLP